MQCILLFLINIKDKQMFDDIYVHSKKHIPSNVYYPDLKMSIHSINIGI